MFGLLQKTIKLYLILLQLILYAVGARCSVPKKDTIQNIVKYSNIIYQEIFNRNYCAINLFNVEYKHNLYRTNFIQIFNS